MKIAARDAERACASPAADWVGILLYGADQGLVAARRQQLVAALQGPESADLQVTQLSAAEARRSPADVEAALTTKGFFAGRQIVVIDGATDGLAPVLAPILGDLRAEDGVLVLTADQLPGRSRLRKTFETGRTLAAIALYPQPVGTREIGQRLSELGAGDVSDEAVAAMAALAAEMDHGAFRQFLDVVATYALDHSRPLQAADVAALAPIGLDGDMDGFVMAIADGRAQGVGPALRRLAASGAAPVGIALALQRHFRGLLAARSSDAGLSAMRPPPQGPRRDRIMRQMRDWDAARLEQANRLLFEVDGRLRSASPTPDFALLERTALRLAMLAAR